METTSLVRRINSAPTGKVWFRSNRIFYTDDGWYVGMGEGDLGPFLDREIAVTELARLKRLGKFSVAD